MATGSSIPLGPAHGSGINIPYLSSKVGEKGHLPKTAVCSLNPFFYYYYHYYSSHACLFRACLLFIREGFALSLTLCTMD